MQTITTPTIPLYESYLSALSEFLSAEENLHYIRKQVHLDVLNYFPNGYDCESESEEEAYLRILEQVEQQYPLFEAGYRYKNAEDGLLHAFLAYMESQASRRELIHLRNLRNGLALARIRGKIIELAKSYRRTL